jgi:hypothetical protein
MLSSSTDPTVLPQNCRLFTLELGTEMLTLCARRKQSLTLMDVISVFSKGKDDSTADPLAT